MIARNLGVINDMSFGQTVAIKLDSLKPRISADLALTGPATRPGAPPTALGQKLHQLEQQAIRKGFYAPPKPSGPTLGADCNRGVLIVLLWDEFPTNVGPVRRNVEVDYHGLARSLAHGINDWLSRPRIGPRIAAGFKREIRYLWWEH